MEVVRCASWVSNCYPVCCGPVRRDFKRLGVCFVCFAGRLQIERLGMNIIYCMKGHPERPGSAVLY